MPAAKKTTSRRVRRTKDAAAAPAAEETVNARDAAPATDAPVAEVSPALAEANELIAELTGIVETLKTENTRLRDANKVVLASVEATVKKAVKYVRKATKGKRPKRKASPNSGFQKPVAVTDELCKFLNKPTGTLISRTDVGKSIREYIKAHDLQNPADRREIRPDNTLARLLRINQADLKDEPLTYFNLNGKMNHLFVKA
jgi:upstream activation factor subunit UAF30